MLCLKVKDKLVVTADNGQVIEFTNREKSPIKIGIDCPGTVRVVRSEVKPRPGDEPLCEGK
jgi:sRNA-binding carbon storage regulator CsrA